jgi:hypothetical protein
VERELTEVATKYSLRAQKLERELTETAIRAQKLERELTETATRYSLWVKSWNANSTGLIRNVRVCRSDLGPLVDGSAPRTASTTAQADTTELQTPITAG